MTKYFANINWKRNGANFIDNSYHRSHLWHFDGVKNIPASSSPHVVPVPLSNSEAIDPEEAFVASLSSCHMLWFLSIAAKQGYVVDEYKDVAKAIMEKNNEGKMAITRVILHPVLKYFPNAAPTEDKNSSMHHEAHDKCFLANSVRTKIEIQPAMSLSDN